ncbi:DUF7344 domain-containing protein [Salinigranum salinum]|uniref:DUF7344 domain-containing protein n=1 Tax=Salinigranum salinum TaxID=1364937 RepID=UPI00126062D7|nr:hypothetical protein [Salinigranum salinum]
MLDNQFEALSSPHRRRLLLALERMEGGTIHPLFRPPDHRGDAGTDPDHEQLVLWHVHLPKLERLGYVTWDPETDEVARGPRFAEIRPLLRFLIRDGTELGELGTPAEDGEPRRRG